MQNSVIIHSERSKPFLAIWLPNTCSCTVQLWHKIRACIKKPFSFQGPNKWHDQFKRHTQCVKWLISNGFVWNWSEKFKLHLQPNIFRLSKPNRFIACIWHGQTTQSNFHYGPLKDDQFHQNWRLVCWNFSST